MDKVLFKQEEGVAWLILNRVDKRNAIDDDCMEALKQHLANVKNNPRIKCLVITGSGDQAFCSGGDLSVFHNLKTAQDAEGMLSKMGSILYELFTFPKPTIALLNGTAVGGGCEIAAACDFRIAYAHASVGFIQGSLGITTGWGGATFLFERLPAQAALSLLTSAKRFTAEEAMEMGFLHKVISNREATRNEVGELIHNMVPLSAEVLSAYKKRYLDSVDLSRLRERLENEIHECSYLWEQDEHAQAVDRFLNK